MISNSEAITIRKIDIALNSQDANALNDLISQLKAKIDTPETDRYSNIQQWQEIYHRLNSAAYIPEDDKIRAGSVIGALLEKTGKKRLAMHLLKMVIIAQENYKFSDFTSSLQDTAIIDGIQGMPALWRHLRILKDEYLKHKTDPRFLDLSTHVYRFLKNHDNSNKDFFKPIYSMLASLDIEYELIYLPPDDAVSVLKNNIDVAGKTKLSITQLNGSFHWLECPQCGDIEKRLYGIASHYCEACGAMTYPYIQDTGSLTWQKNYATNLFKAYRSPNIMLLFPNKENIMNLLPFIEESDYGDDQYIAIMTTKEDIPWIKDVMGQLKYNIYTQNNITEMIEEIRLRCLSVHSVDYLQTR